MNKLRCRAGDIAMITSRGNAGMIVRVIERSPEWADSLYGRPAWEIESCGTPLKIFNLETWEPVGEKMRTRAPDDRLIPLRDGPTPTKKRRRKTPNPATT